MAMVLPIHHQRHREWRSVDGRRDADNRQPGVTTYRHTYQRFARAEPVAQISDIIQHFAGPFANPRQTLAPSVTNPPFTPLNCKHPRLR